MKRPPRIGPWAGVAAHLAALAACAPATHYESPGSVRDYAILVPHQDSLSRAIARALERRGFTVRDRVSGGSRPTAYLFTFLFRETDPPALTWLHVRVADTRTGAIVAAVSAPLDSLGATPQARAGAIVDSLATQPSLQHPLPAPPP